MLKRGFAVVLLCAGTTAQAIDYELGQGVPLGNFLFSGYVNLVGAVPQEGASNLTVDDLSLFVAGRVNRWFNPFVEAEVSSVVLAQSGSGEKEHAHLVRERIYDDMRVSDTETLRVGKILAPVGDWNLIHAAPLVPTTTQPLTTSRGFANYTSGVSWLHESSDALFPDWQVYLQPGEEWFRRPDAVSPRHYRNVYGGHLNWSLGFNDKFGLSLQHGELVSSGETFTLLGTNFRRSFGRLSIESEATAAHWSGGVEPRGRDTEEGIYLLADYAMNRYWHGIVEGEYYQDHALPDTSRNLLFGVTFKPRSAVVWKLEYVDQIGQSRDIKSGWLTSISVLF